MKTLGNILWLIFGGLVAGITYYILGGILCITIIGIPLGKQLFKFGKIMFMPFDKTVETNFKKHPIVNVFWIIICGLWMSISFALTGVVLCITIIGIPFGIQWFKVVSLSMIPFGSEIKKL